MDDFYMHNPESARLCADRHARNWYLLSLDLPVADVTPTQAMLDWFDSWPRSELRDPAYNEFAREVRAARRARGETRSWWPREFHEWASWPDDHDVTFPSYDAYLAAHPEHPHNDW